MTTTLPYDLPAPRTPVDGAGDVRRRWPAAVGGLATGLAVGTAGVAGAVAALTGAPAAAPPAPAPTTLTVNLGAAEGPLSSFGNGTWRVGTDVAPGVYSTAGAAGPVCYHSVHGGVSGADIVASTVSAGAATVALSDGEAFETSGCAPWNRSG